MRSSPDPLEIVNDIAENLVRDGSSMSTYYGLIERPDGRNLMMLTEPIDRAVIVFVGSRYEIHQLAEAGEKILHG